MSDISLKLVEYEEKHILRNLLELYQYDSSEFNDDEINANGLFGYKYLDHYWTEDGRYAYFIRKGETLAGLAMVRIFPEDGKIINSIAEFWIMRRYRRNHYGREAAFLIFNLHRGLWNVCQEINNKPAQSFWKKVIAEYTGGNFYQTTKHYWEGPVLEFEN